MIVSRALPDFTMMSTKVFWRVSRLEPANSSAMPSTPFMGVRISWLMLARNSDFALSAASLRARRTVSSCSRFFISVMSE